MKLQRLLFRWRASTSDPLGPWCSQCYFLQDRCEISLHLMHLDSGASLSCCSILSSMHMMLPRNAQQYDQNLMQCCLALLVTYPAMSINVSPHSEPCQPVQRLPDRPLSPRTLLGRRYRPSALATISTTTAYSLLHLSIHCFRVLSPYPW